MSKVSRLFFFTVFFAAGTAGAASISINETGSCRQGFSSTGVAVDVGSETFNFVFSCNVYNSRAFKTASGTSCTVVSDACTGSLPSGRIQVSCGDGSSGWQRLQCPPLADDFNPTKFGGAECFDQEHSPIPGTPNRMRVYFRSDMGEWIYESLPAGKASWGLRLGQLGNVTGPTIEFSYGTLHRDTQPWTLDWFGRNPSAVTRYTLLDSCQSWESRRGPRALAPGRATGPAIFRGPGRFAPGGAIGPRTIWPRNWDRPR